MDFGGFRTSFWEGFGGHVGLKIRSKIDIYVEEPKVPKYACHLSESLILRSRGASKSNQNRTKIDQKIDQFFMST